MKPIRARVAGGLRQPVERRTGIDGRTYAAPIDDQINRIVFLALNNSHGAALLNYLEGITLRTVLPSNATNEALRDMEGQRRLVADLKSRLKRAQTNDK